MTWILLWLTFAAVQLAATMSPGPAFIISIRNSLSYGRHAAIATAIGLGLGVGVHVTLVLLGIATLMAQSVLVYNLIKYFGAAYLVYIGIKGLRAGNKHLPDDLSTNAQSGEKTPTFWQAIRIGFFTNLLNPKAVIFFTAVFTQFIQPETAPSMQVLYGLTSVFIEMAWFSGLGISLSNPLIRQHFMKYTRVVERIFGGLMIALGVKLAFSKL